MRNRTKDRMLGGISTHVRSFWPYYELDGSTIMFRWKAKKEGPSKGRRGGHEEGRNTTRMLF